MHLTAQGENRFRQSKDLLRFLPPRVSRLMVILEGPVRLIYERLHEELDERYERSPALWLKRGKEMSYAHVSST